MLFLRPQSKAITSMSCLTDCSAVLYSAYRSCVLPARPSKCFQAIPGTSARWKGRLEQHRSKATATASLQPFHLAFPVSSIPDAKEFYGKKLGCAEGRSAATWVDYSLFGHQIVCHEVKGYNAASIHNAVDGDPVPVPHFGLALTAAQFHDLAERVEKAGISFILQPHLRFQGQPGEQWTMFFKDPSGNALEFKAMTKPENLFAKYFVD